MPAALEMARVFAGVSFTLLGLGPACGFVDLTAPRIEGASFALVLFAEEETPRVLVADSQPDAQNATFTSDLLNESLDLVLLGYDRPREELALPLGWVPLGSGDNGRALPEPQHTMSCTFRDGTQGPWQVVAGPPDSVRALKVEGALPVPTRCKAVAEGAPVVIPDSQSWDLTFAVGLSDGHLLLGVRSNIDGRVVFYRVDRVGATPEPALSAAPSAAGFAGEDDRVWLLAADGQYASWSGSTGMSAIEPSGLALGRRVWLTGSRPGAPFELFAYGSAGGLARYDGARWQMLATRTVDDPEGLRTAGLAWVGPGHVVVAGSALATVFRYRDGVGREEVLPEEDDTPTSIVEHPSRGTYVGTKLGRVFRSTDVLRWTAEPSSGLTIQALEPYGCGLVFGGAFGSVSELLEDGSLCSPFLAVPSAVEAIVSAGAETAVIGDSDSAGITIQFLPILSRPASCPP